MSEVALRSWLPKLCALLVPQASSLAVPPSIPLHGRNADVLHR